MKVSNFKFLAVTALVVLSIHQTVSATSQEPVSCIRKIAGVEFEYTVMESVTPIAEVIVDFNPTKKDLLEKIENNNEEFGHGKLTSTETWNEIVSRYPELAYNYATSGSNCKMSNKWFFNYYTCSSSSTEMSKVIKHVQVDVAAKKEELKTLIEESAMVTVSGSLYYLTGKEGKVTIIDTRYPLQANPAAIREGDQTIYLINAN